MFIELHMLQSFAPSNLNRDDTNNPKDCTFGGVRRARISSQAFKRAIRYEPIFADVTQTDLSMRTKRLVDRLSDSLIAAELEEDAAQWVAEAAIGEFAGKITDKQTNVLIYLSPMELDWLAGKIVDEWDTIQEYPQQEKESIKKVSTIVKTFLDEFKERTLAPDIALFGRMLANKPLNVDAACQVAHALSTHRVSMEMDFYTAVDDLQPDGETGAGMMGMIGYNSATFYRYIRIDWRQLVKNLFNDEALAYLSVEGFLRAAVRAIPTGKQTSFAAQNPPEFLLGVVRQDGMSWSLANAFESPVANAFESPVYNNRNKGLIKPSIKQLDQYWGRLHRTYGRDNISAFSLSLVEELSLEHLKETLHENLDHWIDSILNAMEVPAS